MQSAEIMLIERINRLFGSFIRNTRKASDNMITRIPGVVLVLLMLCLPFAVGCSKVQKALGLAKGTEEEAFDEDAESDQESDDVEEAGEGKKSVDKTTEPEPEKESAKVDLRALARKRRAEILAKAKKYNRYPATRQLVHKKYGVDLDVVFPDGNYALNRFPRKHTVAKLIETEADETTRFEFPASMLQKVVKQAEAMHPLYKIGDMVEARIGKRNIRVHGKLEAVYHDFVLVGGKRILVEDLHSPNPIHFNPAAIKSRRQLFVRTNYEEPRKRFLARTKREIGPRTYRDHGLVQSRKKWVSLKTLIPKHIDPEVDAEEARHYRLQKLEAERQVARDFRKQGLLPSK